MAIIDMQRVGWTSMLVAAHNDWVNEIKDDVLKGAPVLGQISKDEEDRLRAEEFGMRRIVRFALKQLNPAEMEFLEARFEGELLEKLGDLQELARIAADHK